jgi:hypothetical protein
MPIDVLTGFLKDDNGTAYGRPVGVTVDQDGSLLVADDVGNTIWRVTAENPDSKTSSTTSTAPKVPPATTGTSPEQ